MHIIEPEAGLFMCLSSTQPISKRLVYTVYGILKQYHNTPWLAAESAVHLKQTLVFFLVITLDERVNYQISEVVDYLGDPCTSTGSVQSSLIRH